MYLVGTNYPGPCNTPERELFNVGEFVYTFSLHEMGPRAPGSFLERVTSRRHPALPLRETNPFAAYVSHQLAVGPKPYTPP